MAAKRRTEKKRSSRNKTAKKSGKMSWPMFVKNYAKKNGIKFGDALADKNCSKEYHAQ